MPELFIELFGEEIPARLQARGADELVRLVGEVFSTLSPSAMHPFAGPRRIALAAEVAADVPAASSVERGPRVTAPEQALAGFLRKHGAAREALRREGDFWVLEKASPAVDAARLVADAMPGLLRRLAWPKSMRWGGTSAFTWIRPLRRIVCLLDGVVVPFSLAAEGDDGHGLASANLTEGHRVHAPGAFPVSGVVDWQASLLERRVVAQATERARLIRDGIAELATARGLTVVEDPGLLDEMAGLVEWPVPLLGRIDDSFMDLPQEVMQVSMRVNQRYFALRDAAGRPAPWFGFAANVAAADEGAAIVAGNERVLRARFSDARHFWDLDRRTRLVDRVAALDGVTFHAELGSQGDRVRRLVQLAGVIAPLVGAEVMLAQRAALLCKADLTTGMVGEFPELQGVMGGYYAAHDGEDAPVAAAVRDHYAPRGPGDAVPSKPVSIAVALADKLDQLVAFFSIGEKPTGSGDPYALRRAALGVIRIIRENSLRLKLRAILMEALRDATVDSRHVAADLLAFITDRLRVLLRSEGARYDVLTAVFEATREDDLLEALAKTEALSAMLATEHGANLLAAYKRAVNILRVEERKDGPHDGPVRPEIFAASAEHGLFKALNETAPYEDLLDFADYTRAIKRLATLRQPVDEFFTTVTVNTGESMTRLNRLRLLGLLRFSMSKVADFSVIES